MFLKVDCFSHIAYGSSLSSWPTPQPVNDFANELALCMKTLDVQSLDVVFITKVQLLGMFPLFMQKNVIVYVDYKCNRVARANIPH